MKNFSFSSFLFFLFIAGILLVVVLRYFNETDPPQVVEKKLHVILADDLKYLVDKLREKAPEEVMENAHYKMVSFVCYDPSPSRLQITEYANQGFNYKAVVDFYYYSKIKKKQRRKFRFNYIQGKWERYAKAFRSLGPDNLPDFDSLKMVTPPRIEN